MRKNSKSIAIVVLALSIFFVILPQDVLAAETDAVGQVCIRSGVASGSEVAGAGGKVLRCQCSILGGCTFISTDKTLEQFNAEEQARQTAAAEKKKITDAIANAIVSPVKALADLVGSGLWWTTKQVLFVIGTVILEISGGLLYVAGILLNYAIAYSVVGMSAFVSQIDGIKIAWGAIRDLANIVFIFLLVYIAVKTILGLTGTELKSLLAKIIIVALIINFSLFFTKVIIDASNVVAIQFYYAAVGKDNDSENAGFSFKIMEMLRLTSIYNAGGRISTESGLFLDTGWNLNPKGYGIIVLFMSSAVILITALTFFYAAAMFIARFAILVFLMATSPFAYVGLVLPKASEYVGEWWKMLIKQTLFAPVFLILMWIAITVVLDPKFILAGMDPNATWTDITNGVAKSVAIFLNFGLVITFMWFSLKMAQNVGGKGAALITKAVGTAALGPVAFGLRKTIGQGAYRLAQSEAFQKAAAKGGLGGFVSNLGLKTTRGVAKRSFDVRAAPGVSALGVDMGKAGGKGGFIGGQKEVAKEEVAYSKEAFKPEFRKEYAASMRSSIIRKMAGTNTKIADDIDKERLKKVKLETLEREERELVARLAELPETARRLHPERAEELEKLIKDKQNEIKLKKGTDELEELAQKITEASKAGAPPSDKSGDGDGAAH